MAVKKSSRYTRFEEHQRQDDARRERERFTGVAFDSIMGDYAIWRHGKVVGYARTYHEALVRSSLAAEAAITRMEREAGR